MSAPLIAVFSGTTLEPIEGGALLLFSSVTQSAMIIIETTLEARQFNSAVTFDIKVTHPTHVLPTPREGVLRQGLNQIEVHVKLLELESLDTAELAASPIRLMISATCSEPHLSHKTKLICDSASVQQCAAAAAAASKKNSQRSTSSKPTSRSSTPSTPTPHLRDDVVSRRQSGHNARALPSTQQHHQDPSHSIGALKVPAQSTSAVGLFSILMKLKELRVSTAHALALFPQGTMCCVQWKRGTEYGNTQWRTMIIGSGHQPTFKGESDEVCCCSFESEEIIIPRCEPSPDGKRILLSLGLAFTNPSPNNGAPATSIRGTLKLDASLPREMDFGDTLFPVAIDGNAGAATLVASLLMTPIKQQESLEKSTKRSTTSTPTTSAPSTPPPQQSAAPAAPRSSIVQSPPPSQVANLATSSSSTSLTPPPPVMVGGMTGSIARSATAHSLNNLNNARSQLETLDSTLRSGGGGGGGALSPSALGSPSSAAEASPLHALNASMRMATPTNAGDVSTNPLRSFERQMPKSSNVQVAVRIRPRLPFEAAYQSEEAWSHNDNSITAASNDRQYQFDYVFSPSTSTRKVFDTLCPELIENALFGVNGTIFMYGQTASGKTHTMFGSEQEMGITPLVIGALFREIEAKRKEHPGMEALVTASYFEIYNEELNDLLDLSKKNLQVRSGSDGGFIVDVSGVGVRTVDEAMQVLVHGSYNKKMGQSHLNDRSSRSHSIFKVIVEVTGIELTATSHATTKSRTKSQKTTAELCLVDLAGSETLQEKSGSSQRKETTNINLSLTYLKKVIWELAHKERHVSYRNSALTKVLKQAVGGNSRTCVVCCITASPEHFRDSRNTLAFGTTAKSVVTTTKVNTSASPAADAAEVKRLQTELQRLHTIIEAYESTVHAYVVMEDDFRKVLEENGTMADRIDALEVEKVTLTEAIANQRNSTSMSVVDGVESGAVSVATPIAAGESVSKRFTMPNAVLRANAEEHAALLEEAISRLNEVAVSEPDTSRTPTDAAVVSYEEGTLDEDDDMFDEVDDDSPAEQQRGRRASAAQSPTPGIQRPAAPRVRPPPTKNRPVGGITATRPLTAPRTVESLQLQLIQQTIDHRHELLKKDQEIERIHALQVRPSDEIPEIMKKEEKVCVLLDQLHSFLHHGTPMRLVYTGDTQMSSTVDVNWSGASLPRTAPRIARVFMYLYTYHQKETFLCFCLVDAEGKLPKRSSCFEKILIKDIKRIELGQYSDSFDKLRTWSSSNPPAANSSTSPTTTDWNAPPASTTAALEAHKSLCKETLDRRRMSFTVVVKKGKQFECVCEDEADFEAWVIELNRLLGTSAEWKNPLEISNMEFYEVLDEQERQFCSTMHIHPDEFMRAKQKMLRRKEKFVTLFDVRALAQFDLYHSQRFFYFLRCQGWVSQAALFYLTDKFIESAQPNLDDL
ncbi:kinesin, putative [Bodo saltans]|uniref:Kinesin, putative n=1 Tax=Bodo saltans TaxID=75058 RepID=A0A0S4JH51_BODSA|nr:kinesin, putative [Bodo saltans]|eukprot:CUG89559.1 kinesin, putative [Bodo saltans]